MDWLLPRKTRASCRPQHGRRLFFTVLIDAPRARRCLPCRTPERPDMHASTNAPGSTNGCDAPHWLPGDARGTAPRHGLFLTARKA